MSKHVFLIILSTFFLFFGAVVFAKPIMAATCTYVDFCNGHATCGGTYECDADGNPVGPPPGSCCAESPSPTPPPPNTPTDGPFTPSDTPTPLPSVFPTGPVPSPTSPPNFFLQFTPPSQTYKIGTGFNVLTYIVGLWEDYTNPFFASEDIELSYTISPIHPLPAQNPILTTSYLFPQPYGLLTLVNCPPCNPQPLASQIPFQLQVPDTVIPGIYTYTMYARSRQTNVTKSESVTLNVLPPDPGTLACNAVCFGNNQCQSGYCDLTLGGICRNLACSSDNDCVCSGGTSTPTPTPQPTVTGNQPTLRFCSQFSQNNGTPGNNTPSSSCIDANGSQNFLIEFNTAPTFTWTTTNVTNCMALRRPDPGEILWTGLKPINDTSGNQRGDVINIYETRAFTLTCFGANGSAVEATFGFTPNPLPTNVPYTVDIKARSGTNAFSDGPITIPTNTSAELSWTSNCTGGNVVLTATGSWTGNKAVTGTQTTGNLASTQTYTLECRDSKGGGLRASDSVTVNIGTASGTPTLATTVSPTSTTGLVCNQVCTGNLQCASGFCDLTAGGVCRNPLCSSDITCTCSGGSGSVSPTGPGPSIPPGLVGGTILVDSNNNGICDEGDRYTGGAELQMNDVNSGASKDTTSDGSGNYQF